MKKTLFVLGLLAAFSCTRQNLNYQSSHENANGSDDVYPVAPQGGGGGGQNNYNSNGYNNSANNNQGYNAQNYNTQGYSNNSNNVDYGSPSYQTFYDGLAPYGNWINYPPYGYVWAPTAGLGFTPYSTNGYWVYTSYGWTWNSGYQWGWAPFHYGSWFQDPFYGWIWVPGNQWAPAWVTWGSYNGYYGWAPVEPGVVVSSGYSPPLRNWTFAQAQSINAPNNVVYYPGSNIVPAQNNIVLINNTNTYAQHTYFAGPPREQVEQATGSKVNTVAISEANKPVTSSAGNNTLNLYRPVINQSTARKAAPAKVTPIDKLQPANNKPRQGSSPTSGTESSNNPQNPPHQKQSGEPGQTEPPAQPAHSQPQQQAGQAHPVNKPPQKPGQKPAPKPKVNNAPPQKPAPKKD